MTKIYGFIALLFAFTGTYAQKKFTLDDLDKLTALSEPRISPDGKTVLVVTAKPDFETNKRTSSLIAIDATTGKQKVLTYDRTSINHVRWSPDGDMIAFLSINGTGKDAKFQVFTLPFQGGEAKKLTNQPAGVSQFTWKPDGTAIAFVAEDDPTNKASQEKGYDAFEVQANSYLLNKMPQCSHIWMISLDSSNPRRLTSGSWSLPISYPPSSPASPLSWSPDGKFIAFTKNESPYSGEICRSIQTLEVSSGSIKPLTGRTCAANQGLLSESYPTYSPDGKFISYRYPLGGIRGGNEVFVTAASGGAGADITVPIDRNLFLSEWTADSKSVLVGGNDGAHVSLWLQPIQGKAIKLNLGEISPANAFNIQASMSNTGAIAFIGSGTQSAPELYFMANHNAALKKLSRFNDVVSAMNLGKVEVMEWKSDQYTCNGTLTFPPDFDPMKKYPLVLIIHGGPQSASMATFGAQAQYAASRGFIIFQPNYRGSDNLGNVFDNAIAKDAGEGPGRDVMTALAILKKRIYVDTGKVAVSGWSYGGYMTTWLIGHYPNAWKCAVAGAPVTDIVSQYSFGDYGPGRKFSQGGVSPYTSDSIMQSWVKQSPISNVRFVKTPTLLIHDVGDERVPIVESYTFFRGLKDNNVEAKFIAIPVSGHSPGDPVHNREASKVWMEWLDQHLLTKGF